MHGQFYWDLEWPSGPSVDKKKSLAWLGSSGLKAETEGLIIQVQNQTQCASSSEKHQEAIDSKCETAIRQNNPQPITHSVAGYTILAPSEYWQTQYGGWL